MLLGISALSYAQESFEVLATSGQATLINTAGEEKVLSKGDRVKPGETVRVSEDGYVDVAQDEDRENVTRLESGSEVVFQKIDPAVLSVDKGSVFANLKRLPAGSSFEVQTPVAIAVVRGTRYRTAFNEGSGAQVSNFSNSPVYVYGIDADGKRMTDPLILRNEEKTEIAKQGEKPSEPLLMSEDELKKGETSSEGLQESREEAPGPDAGRTEAAEAEKTLAAMADSYQSKDLSAFLSNLSPDMPFRGEMEEFVKRDFQDYDNIRVNLFFKRAVETANGADVQVDWQMQFFPNAAEGALEARGENLNFEFRNEGGKLALVGMRGANPLFGGRSPEIAAMAGAGSAIVRALEEAQDSSNRAARQTAMLIVSSDDTVNSQETPVGVEIIGASAFDGTNTISLQNMPGTTITIQPQLSVRLISNPKNITLENVTLEVTDSRTGTVLRGSGNLLPNTINVLRTHDSQNISAPASGVYTFVIDPEKNFNILNREDATFRERYNI